MIAYIVKYWETRGILKVKGKRNGGIDSRPSSGKFRAARMGGGHSVNLEGEWAATLLEARQMVADKRLRKLANLKAKIDRVEALRPSEMVPVDLTEGEES